MIRRGIGVQSFVSAGVPTDADAQAFITAAGITDATQQSAINTLVTDLKGYGIWSKMKAIYPMVGGTASSHRWNLRDPRDLDAAFRLVFSGGITHSSTGVLFNGTNGYGDTFFNPSVSFSNNNLHLSYYVRTYTANVNGKVLMGAGQSSNTTGTIMNWSTPSNPPFYYPTLQEWSFPAISTFPTKITGLHIGRRIDASNQTLFINNVKYNSAQSSNNKLPNNKISLGSNKDVNYQQYVDCQCAFASIGDGLTDTDAANLYTSVQKYQTTLGRHVGTPIVADNDAQAFLNAAEITSVTEANAVDKLVTDLKTYGIWSKMKAIYPFVGGTSSTHKWNLKDPRDLDAAFRLVFSGGITHSSTGVLWNGTNGFGDTKFNPQSNLAQFSTSISYYSRTNNDGTYIEAGSQEGINLNQRIVMHLKYSGFGYYDQNDINTGRLTVNLSSINSTGLFIMTRTANNIQKAFRNSSQIGSTNTNTISTLLPTTNVYLGAYNFATPIYTNRECAFASIGDGLTDTEASNLYTAVQAYQTSLNRQV